MAMRIPCSHCEHTLVVSEELKGKLVRCPKCKELNRIPGGSPAKPGAKPTRLAAAAPPGKNGAAGKTSIRPGNGKVVKKTMLARDDEGIVDRKKSAPVPAPRTAKTTRLARPDDEEMDERPIRKRPTRADDEEMAERPLRKRPTRAESEEVDERPLRKRPTRDEDYDDEDTAPRGRRSAGKGRGGDEEKSRSPMIWIAAGGGGLVVAGIAAALFFFLRSPSADNTKQVAQNPPVIVKTDMPIAPPINPPKNDAGPKNPVTPKADPKADPTPVTPKTDPMPPSPKTDPNPTTPKTGPSPVPVPLPKGQPQVTPIPDGPAPSYIEVATTKKVKKATVYLKVEGANRSSAEGSGFFGVEPGIVLTNAHVVGMLSPNSAAPKKIDVVVNSGQGADEVKLVGTVLGVDRENDLAVVRVTGDLTRCPPPLPVELEGCSLTELQKVYIFGFPLGSGLGKEITVSESSVSSLRKDTEGSLNQIQVNGGMHPGNSGGPVIDSRGVVVGVAVAGIRGTNINFAVPAEKIQGMLHGRVLETLTGEAYLHNQAVKLPLKIACLDPLQRIRELKVDVWTGPAGATRPASLKAPTHLPGDSPKQPAPVAYVQGLGTLELVLPTLKLPDGHVYWIQPTLTNHSGVQQWGATTTINPSQIAPLTRSPANLTFSTASSERTLVMAGKFEFQMIRGKEKIVESDNLDFQVLEEMTNDPKGAALRVAMGKGDFTTHERGKTMQRKPEAQTMVKRKIFNYATDPNGRLERFGFPQFRPTTPPIYINPKGKGKLPPQPPPISIEKEITYIEAEDMASMFNSTYQLSSLSVPNRQVQPLEVWDGKIAMLVGTGKKKTTLDLLMKFTYEGSRTVNGKTEALVTIAGELERRNTGKEIPSQRPKSRIVGQGSFDVAGGFFTKLKVAVRSQGEFDGMSFSNIFEVNLTRVAGNVYNIGPLPPRNPAPGPNPNPSPGPNPNPTPGPNPNPGPGPSGPKPGETRVVGGGGGDPVARDQAPPDALLIGFEVGMGNRDVVKMIRPIYRSAKGETKGNSHGAAGLKKMAMAKAKDGYAVGAVKAKVGLSVDGFSVTFMRIKDGKLDPSDSYESPWLGGPGGNRFETVGDGTPVVGIVARTARGEFVGVGLILKTPGGPGTAQLGPAQPGPASSTPVSR